MRRDGGERRSLPGRPSRRRFRAGAARYLAARHRRHGGPRAHSGPAVRRAARGRRDLRPRQHRSRGQGHQAGRFRFSRKAALHRQDLRRRQERARAPRHGARKQSAQTGFDRPPPHHRRERPHEGAAPAALAHGRHQRPRAHLWRKRHRQGTGGARPPCPQFARRRGVRGSQLRRHSGRVDRKRAVRPHQGQLHQRP